MSLIVERTFYRGAASAAEGKHGRRGKKCVQGRERDAPLGRGTAQRGDDRCEEQEPEPDRVCFSHASIIKNKKNKIEEEEEKKSMKATHSPLAPARSIWYRRIERLQAAPSTIDRTTRELAEKEEFSRAWNSENLLTRARARGASRQDCGAKFPRECSDTPPFVRYEEKNCRESRDGERERERAASANGVLKAGSESETNDRDRRG